MAVPIVYRSTDASAPALSGTAGALLTVLDAILVNGYGSKAAAGWNKNSLANATNRGAYKPGASAGANIAILSVDDNAPSSGRDARCRGFETLTAVTPTGTNQNPNGAEIAVPNAVSLGYVVLRKSSSADATARPWVCIADDRTFWFFSQTGDVGQQYASFGYGDITAFSTADAWRHLILGRHSETAGIGGANAGLELNNTAFQNENLNSQLGHYMGRNSVNSYGPWQMNRFGVGGALFKLPFTGTGGLNPQDSKIYLNRLLLSEANTTQATAQTYGLRGYIRGVYQMLNGGTGIADGDTFSGAGDFAGRTFLVVGPLLGGAMVAIETTAWDN